MEPPTPADNLPNLARIATGIPGLDAILGGGLVVGDAYLVAGQPGTGKTTLGNHLAFAHAAAGGAVLVATLLTEPHDRLIGHLRSLAFFDPALAGGPVRYLSLLRPLEERGIDGLLEALRQAVRDHGATLLVVDGAAAAETLAASGFAYGRFVQGLQARSAMMGCTTILLSSSPGDADSTAANVDGVVELALEPAGSRDARWLRVTKLRGAAHLSGRHAFAITANGIEVYPRLEAALGAVVPPPLDSANRVSLGVPGLDAMLIGGLPARANALVMGTPGAGKTVLGIQFLVAGARRGEPGLVASFHETAESLATTAAELGLPLGEHLASGLVRALWQPPLEASPDAWAWALLREVEAHRPRRLVIDAYTDLARTFAVADRQVAFLTALANSLRAHDVTVLFTAEIDAFTGQALLPPIPAISASADVAVLLRTAELGSRLVRVASVLKSRQTGFDHAIRAFTLGRGGIEIGEPFGGVGNLLAGDARPLAEDD